MKSLIKALTVSLGSPGSMAPTALMPYLSFRPPAHTAVMLSVATVMGPSGLTQDSRLRTQG